MLGIPRNLVRVEITLGSWESPMAIFLKNLYLTFVKPGFHLQQTPQTTKRLRG